jgi:hypothetical protein
MNANRTKPGRRSSSSQGAARDSRVEPDADDNAGSGTRRRSSQPVARVELRRRSSQPAQRAVSAGRLPPPTREEALEDLEHEALEASLASGADDPPTASREAEEELDTRVFMLLTRLDADDGMVLPPGPWVAVADVAKRRGFIEEHGLRLYLKKRGRQELEQRAQPAGRQTTMTKIYPPDRLLLKDLSHETGVAMQDAIGLVLAAVYEHRDALTRVARANGLEYPWEGIGLLLKSGARK